ncbi:class I SAM-dependent methyltransferase [Roseomonas fluvialis]|uniref:Class I SAM-dependent methyltransferase n=1 Tax=Roseomonas fluvialis TaxID=1750527 RepID=A0ABM7Y9E3_9PROT|nr:class I SAM-dependent methyltransferase [Roseomonas fluvialis]BDG75134.1 hypothetical protein Rmf_50630 [Roseomonas fluvialis]
MALGTFFRTTPPQVEAPLARYRSLASDIEGFFQDGAIACWDYLLATQTAMAVPGHALEIGVYRGKSALLAACHMKAGETIILNDISPVDDTVAKVQSLGGPDALSVIVKSTSLLHQPQVAPFFGAARWIHIDGDHTAAAATNDLHVAERFLAERGVICVDDFFNPRYPQVTAAVYHFLRDRQPLYRMVLCGERKAYIVRAADFDIYESLVRKFLAAHLRGCGFVCTIHKSTDSADYGCYSIGPRENDRDYIGLDQDHDRLPV